MEIRVPLKRFIQFVNDAKKLDEEYPCLKQREWLLKNGDVATRPPFTIPRP